MFLVTMIGCSGRPNVFTESSDARVQRLAEERGRLQTTTDPVGRTRIQVRISDLLISFVGDAADIGDVELIESRIDEYRQAILDARNTMLNSGRDPLEDANGYRDIEIAIRQHIRQLDDIGSVLSFDRRQTLDNLIAEVAAIRDEMLELLFPDQNAD
jgi:hypothetical protein